MASGLAIALTSTPTQTRTALRARASFDGLDILGFGALSPRPEGRLEIAAVAAAWGGLALALDRALRRQQPRFAAVSA